MNNKFFSNKAKAITWIVLSLFLFILMVFNTDFSEGPLLENILAAFGLALLSSVGGFVIFVIINVFFDVFEKVKLSQAEIAEINEYVELTSEKITHIKKELLTIKKKHKKFNLEHLKKFIKKEKNCKTRWNKIDDYDSFGFEYGNIKPFIFKIKFEQNGEIKINCFGVRNYYGFSCSAELSHVPYVVSKLIINMGKNRTMKMIHMMKESNKLMSWGVKVVPTEKAKKMVRLFPEVA
jgi:hypothetical protein